MRNKSLVVAISLLTATGLSATAHGAGEKSTCLQDLKKNNSFRATIKAAEKCQERAIGRMAVQGVLEGEDLNAVIEKKREFSQALTEALEDNKISAQEKAALKDLRKQAADRLFETSLNSNSVNNRIEKMESRIAAGVAAGELTEEEASALRAQKDKIAEQIANLSAGAKPKTKDLKQLKEKLRSLSETIFDDRRDAEGEAKKTPNRDKDNIDEIQRNQAARIVACVSKNSDDQQFNQLLEQQKKLRQKEKEYLRDGKLDKDEVSDLQQLYSQANMDIGQGCKEQASGTTTNTTSSQPPAYNPLSDKPMEPGQKIDTAL